MELDDIIDRKAIVKLSPLLSPPEDRPLTNAEKKERWKISHGKMVDPAAQALYDSMTSDEQIAFNAKLVELNRSLADMRVTAAGHFDKRLLLPRLTVPNSNGWNGRKSDRRFFHEPGEQSIASIEKAGVPDDDNDSPENFQDAKDRSRASGVVVTLDEKIPDGEDLAKYIKRRTGDGRALADFYLKILTMEPRDCRKNGVFTNHKQESAKWLAERGWGRVGTGDIEDRATTINLINYGEASVQPKPPTIAPQAITEQSIASAEADAGKDAPRSDDDDPPIPIVKLPRDPTIIEEDPDPIR